MSKKDKFQSLCAKYCMYVCPLGSRAGDVRLAQLPYSPSLTTPLLVDAAGREARDKQRRERAREQLLKINQRKREEKARGEKEIASHYSNPPPPPPPSHR